MSKRTYEDLKEILCHELGEITRKGDIDRESLDDVYKLSSAITMIESLMKKGQQGQQQEGEYSQDGMSNRMNMRRSYEGGMSNDGSYDNMSYERGTTDGRDMGRSRAYNGISRDYSRESYENYQSNDSYARGRGADGRYVSRDSYGRMSNDSYARDMSNDSYDSYDSYERGYSRHTAEQMVVAKLQDILATTKDHRIRKAITQAMEKIDN